MLRSNKDHKYILCISIDELMIYLITVPIHHFKWEEIGNALIKNMITKYCVSDYIIMDQDSTFISTLMNYLFEKLDIRIKTVAPYNYQSLQAEHGIKWLSTILMKHFTNLSQTWSQYLPIAISACNTLNTPNLSHFSPYELVFSRKPKLLSNLETMLNIKVSGTFKDNYIILNKDINICTNYLKTLNPKG